MAGYEPPYRITTKIYSLSMEIAQELSKLEYIESYVITPTLRKKNRIKTIAGTLEIEGNFLGEEKVTAIIEGKRVLGRYEEILEVEGVIGAYKLFESYRYDHIEDLLKAHKILMGNLLDSAGEFRSIDVGVGSSEGVSHIAPPHKMVPQLMYDLFEWLRDSDEHLLIKSCVFHYEFEFIHPFSDGNGRIGRLWQSVILYHWNKIFSVIPTESIVRDYQSSYYKALEDASSMGEATPFIEFMLEAILESIKRVGNEVGNRVGNNRLTSNQEKILEYIEANPKISAQILSQNIGISKRKIEENIAKLKKMGILKRVGGTRGYWEIIK